MAKHFGWLINSFIHSGNTYGAPTVYSGLLWWLSGEESPASAGDAVLIPGPGRSPGEGNRNPLQYSWLEFPTDRGAWRLQSMGSQRVGYYLATHHHHDVLGCLEYIMNKIDRCSQLLLCVCVCVCNK